MATKPAIPAHARNRASNYLNQTELKNYIPFSSLTKGAVGRPVQIDVRLLPAFLSAVDPQTHDGKNIIRQMENLRALAGHQESHQSSSSAFDHMIPVKNLQIYYRISGAGVYITNLKMTYEADAKAAGLYEVYESKGFGKKMTTPVKNDKIPFNAKAVYINGAVSRFEEAVAASQEFFPDEKSLALFYYPSSIVNELGIWKSTIKTNRSLAAIAKLAEVIKKNQGTKSVWAAEAEGTALLAESLKSVPGELDNHTYRLINPVGDTAKLLTTLKGKKALFAAEPININKNHRASYFALLAQQAKLVEFIASLPVSKINYVAEARTFLVDDIQRLGSGFSASTKPGVSKTFVDVAHQAAKFI